MKVRTRPLLLAAALLAGTVVPLAAPAAADTGPVPLGMTSFARIVADEAHGRLFLSPGPRGTGVRVTDLQGGAATTIDGLPGATGMALTPDGRSLWVALPGVGALKRVDTATLAVQQTIPVPTGHCPGDVAVVGDRLVYGHSCNRYGPDGGGYGGLGVVDAVSGASYGGVTSGPFYEPVLATGPAGFVYAADAGLSPATLYLYDVRGAAPVEVASRWNVCSNLRDLSAKPGGSEVVTACGHPYQHQIYVAADKLALSGSYPSGAYPNAGAWSGDGSTFVSGLDSAYEPDVLFNRLGENAPVRWVDFGGSTSLLQARGLAASTDGRRAWAVASSPNGLALHVLDLPRTGAATLTVSASPGASYQGTPVTASGRLATPTGAPLAGEALRVSRMATGENPVPLPSVTTATDGTFSFTDTPPVSGSYTYAVSRDADAARGEVSVLVWSTEPRLSLDLDRGAFGGAPVQGSLRLSHDGPTSSAGRTISLVRVGGGLRATLPPVVTDAQGRATFTDAAPAGDFTYTASVGANGLHPAVTATATTTVLTATKLSAVAPGAVAAGTPVTVTGLLSTPTGGLAGGTVTVLRSGCGTVDPGWSIATSPDGRYAVTDSAPSAGTCTYRASYAGQPGYTSSTASATTTVSTVPTALVMDTLSPTVAGSPVVVRGTLVVGGSPAPGASVLVTRAGCSTAGWQASGVTTDNGSWSVTDPAAAGGACTYRASYAGTSASDAATDSASVAVSFRTTDLSLAVTRGTGSNKKFAYVTAQLGAWHTGKTLRITAQPNAGAEVLLVTGTVDGAGRLTATYQPKTTTTYRVTYAGDDWYAPAKAERLQ